MDCASLQVDSGPVSVQGARFVGRDGVEEMHLTLCPTEYGAAAEQLAALEAAYDEARNVWGLPAGTAVFRRFFCSDLPNQAAVLESRPFARRHPDEPCAVSWVRQPPTTPAKLALWAYHVRDPRGPLEKVQENGCLALRRDGLTHCWSTGMRVPGPEAADRQTERLFTDYDGFLQRRAMSLADNVVRTWLFVQNVDANYQGMVDARRAFFAARGLTAETHYIASTGIEGADAEVAAKVLMDAYAVAGLQPEQLTYLAAPDHLCPTHHYGVTFERATAVAFRDRTHVLLSGTASIDHRGEIVHAGDMARQLDRTLENVAALLAQADATLADMAVLLAYVRDPSDQHAAETHLRRQFADVPLVVLTAPVCRPGWLVEVEGTAIVPADRPTAPAF